MDREKAELTDWYDCVCVHGRHFDGALRRKYGRPSGPMSVLSQRWSPHGHVWLSSAVARGGRILEVLRLVVMLGRGL